jgi:hypothetical protein
MIKKQIPQKESRSQPAGQPRSIRLRVRNPNETTSVGQSAVEFALIVTTAIIMFLGMAQFGMCLYGLSIVENAARHAARIGSVSQPRPPPVLAGSSVGNDFCYKRSAKISGFCSAMRNSATAGPLGLRRPCSQSCTVRRLTPIKPAKADCDNLSFARMT